MTDRGSRVNAQAVGGTFTAPAPVNRTRTPTNRKPSNANNRTTNNVTVEENTRIDLPVTNNQRRVLARPKPTVKLGQLGTGEASGRNSPTNANRIISQNVSSSSNGPETQIQNVSQEDQTEQLNIENQTQEVDAEGQIIKNGRLVTATEVQQLKESKNVEIKRIELPAENKLPLLGSISGQRRTTARHLVSVKRKSESDNSRQIEAQDAEIELLEVGEERVGQESVDSNRLLLEQSGSDIDLYSQSAQRSGTRGSQMMMEKKIEEINKLADQSLSQNRQQTVVTTETVQTEGGQRTMIETTEKTTVHHELEPSKALPLKGTGPKVFNRAVRAVKPADPSTSDISVSHNEVMSQLTQNTETGVESYDTRTTDGLKSINLTYSDDTARRTSEIERNSELTTQTITHERNTTLSGQVTVETTIEKVRMTGLDGGPLPIKGGQRKFNRPVLTAKSNHTHSDTNEDNLQGDEINSAEGEAMGTFDEADDGQHNLKETEAKAMLVPETEGNRTGGDLNAETQIANVSDEKSNQRKETIQTVENNELVRIATGETKDDGSNTPVILKTSGEPQIIKFLEQQAEAEQREKASLEAGQRTSVKEATAIIKSSGDGNIVGESVRERGKSASLVEGSVAGSVGQTESMEAVQVGGTSIHQTKESEQRQSSFVRKDIITVTKTYTMQDKETGELPILQGGRKFNRPKTAGNKLTGKMDTENDQTEITGEIAAEEGEMEEETEEGNEEQVFEDGNEDTETGAISKGASNLIAARTTNAQQTQKPGGLDSDTAIVSDVKTNTIKSAEPLIQQKEQKPAENSNPTQNMSSSAPVVPLLPSLPASPLDDNLPANQRIPSIDSAEEKLTVQTQATPQTNLRIKELQAKIQANSQQRQEQKPIIQTTTVAAAVQNLTKVNNQTTPKLPNSVAGQGGFSEGGIETTETEGRDGQDKQRIELKRRFMNSFESGLSFEAEKIVLPINRESKSESIVTAEQQIQLKNTEAKVITEGARSTGNKTGQEGSLEGVGEVEEEVGESRAIGSKLYKEQQLVNEQQSTGAPLTSIAGSDVGNVRVSVGKGEPVTAHDATSEAQIYGGLFSANFAPSLVKPERISDSNIVLQSSVNNDFDEPVEHSAVEAVSIQGGNIDSIKPKESVVTPRNSQTSVKPKTSTDSTSRPKLVTNQQAQNVRISTADKPSAIKDSALGRQSTGASQKQSLTATANRQSVSGNNVANRSSLLPEAPITPVKQGSITPVLAVSKGSVSDKKQSSLISNNVRDSRVDVPTVSGSQIQDFRSSQTSTSKRSVKDSANPTQSTAKASNVTKQSTNDKSGQIRDKSVEGFLGDRRSTGGNTGVSSSAYKKPASITDSRSGSFKSAQKGSSNSIYKDQPAKVSVTVKQANVTQAMRPASLTPQKIVQNDTETTDASPEVILDEPSDDLTTDSTSNPKNHAQNAPLSIKSKNARARPETAEVNENASANEPKIPSEKIIDDDKRSSMSKEGETHNLGLTAAVQAKGLPTSFRTYQIEQVSSPVTRVEYGQQRVVFRGEPVVKSVVQNIIHPSEEEAKKLNHRCCDLPKIEEAIGHFMASVTHLGLQAQVKTQLQEQRFLLADRKQAVVQAEPKVIAQGQQLQTQPQVITAVQTMRAETRSISPQVNVQHVVKSTLPVASQTVSGPMLNTVNKQLNYTVNSPIAKTQAVTFTNAIRPMQQVTTQTLPITQTKVVKVSLPAQPTTPKPVSPSPMYATLEHQFRIDSNSPNTYRRTIFTKTVAQEIGQPKVQTTAMTKGLPVQSQTRVLSPVPVVSNQPVLTEPPKIDYHQAITELQSINTSVIDIDQQFARLSKHEAELRQKGISEVGETELAVILRQKQLLSVQLNLFVQRYYFIIWSLQSVKCTCDQHHILKVEPLNQQQMLQTYGAQGQVTVAARNSTFVNAIQGVDGANKSQSVDLKDQNLPLKQQPKIAVFSVPADTQIAQQQVHVQQLTMAQPMQMHTHSPFIQLGFNHAAKQHTGKTISELEEEWFISQKNKDVFTLETAHALREQTYITQFLAEIYNKSSEKHAKEQYYKIQAQPVRLSKDTTNEATFCTEEVTFEAKEVSTYRQALKQLASQNVSVIIQEESRLLINKSDNRPPKKTDPLVKFTPFFGLKSHLVQPLAAKSDPTSQSRK